MAYIANKPVRFDRDYKIGEVIPEGIIAPSMTRKLVEMGRILHVDLPQRDGAEDNPGQQQKDPQGGTETPPDGDGGAGNINTQPDGESPQEGQETPPDGDGEPPEEDGEDADAGTEPGGEFVCEVCGRAFKSKNALAAHSRSHKD